MVPTCAHRVDRRPAGAAGALLFLASLGVAEGPDAARPPHRGHARDGGAARAKRRARGPAGPLPGRERPAGRSPARASSRKRRPSPSACACASRPRPNWSTRAAWTPPWPCCGPAKPTCGPATRAAGSAIGRASGCWRCSPTCAGPRTQNCQLANTRDACLAPIRGQGVHQKREGPTRAVEVLDAVLRRGPGQPARALAAQHRPHDAGDATRTACPAAS